MRRIATTATVLLIAALATLATPASAAKLRPCKLLYADFETTWMEREAAEIGWVSGMIEGGIYLKYDDTAGPIDPKNDPPNLLFTSKAGDISLWVYSESVLDGDVWARKFVVYRIDGKGDYANMTFDLGIYGKSAVGKGGSYVIEGSMCPTQPVLSKR
jgi:hypothetical protein